MSSDVKRNIRYSNRDFNSLKNRLIEFSKTYFPDTYNDFTPSSLGVMFIEQASYIGDILNFYLDTQLVQVRHVLSSHVMRDLNSYLLELLFLQLLHYQPFG